jgi:two-component system, LytTR family, response regulator
MSDRPIRTIIVDDEELARRGIELRLAPHADVEIVGHCVNGREAIEAVTEQKPDLMFLDIQMPGLSGFDVLARVPQESMPMVIFVTAFDRYALDAFEAQAIDYRSSRLTTCASYRHWSACAVIGNKRMH